MAASDILSSRFECYNAFAYVINGSVGRWAHAAVDETINNGMYSVGMSLCATAICFAAVTSTVLVGRACGQLRQACVQAVAERT